MFEGFAQRRLTTSGTFLNARIGGSGPPLVLLHGYPQTHLMWHGIAGDLARDFTVVCPDLRGYGDSGRPPSDPEHLAYSKRSMAQDVVEAMSGLGFERFAIAGHDRGGRVTHRLCLDHPGRVERAAVLDIVPTRTLYAATNKSLATSYFHWFFMIQPAPLPERLIEGDAAFYLRTLLGAWSGGATSFVDPAALAEYERCFLAPGTVHATCEDYRAGATIDLAHDEADEDARIRCPLLVLWGSRGSMHRHFDVMATWREKASGPIEGHAVDAGHFLVEERPAEVLQALRTFFRTWGRQHAAGAIDLVAHSCHKN